MLVDNERLYEALEKALNHIYEENEYMFINAIYEPDDDGGLEEGRYHAAVDLHEPGRTHRVYFTVNEEDNITVGTVKRWFIGRD